MKILRHFAFLLLASLALVRAKDTPPAPGRLAAFDRDRLPEALRQVPLDHLSSGALLRLDLDGDLVEAHDPWAARVQARRSQPLRAEAAAIALDRRVSSNIRLGDDPAALPPNFHAQAEPHIARSPLDPDSLLATFQEGRFTNGGAVDCGYSVSHDGGHTWTRALIPGVSSASGGPYPRATDPVAGFDRLGNAFLNTLAATNAQFTTGALLVSRSTDGGNTFAAPVVVYQSPNSNFFPDKNWMASNNFPGTPTAGRIVTTFTLFGPSNQNGAPIYRSFSDDHGVTWSPIAMVDPGQQDTQGSQPIFLPDGRLALVYWNFNNTVSTADDFLAVTISNDGGNTFAPSRVITPISIYSEQSIRTGSILPAATADQIGNLYVVAQALIGGVPKVLFTRSSDAGTTWTAPIGISDNPNGLGVFNPAISASPDGRTLAVVFYDHRNNPNSTTLVDLYLAQSFDGGAIWQPNIRLTSVSTDASLAPLTGSGYMLGDYLGVAESTTPDVPAVPVWVDTRTGDPDPFVTRVGMAAALDYRSWQAAHLSLGQINNPVTGGQPGDADNDGEDNGAEFLAATDPNDPASVLHTGRQLNIATRARVGLGDENSLIGGFIITGTEVKRILLRAVGPSLTAHGVSGALPDPTLQLVPTSGPSVMNDNWRDSDAGNIEATGLPPEDEHESAIVQTLSPGSYTAIVRGKDNQTGVALVEVYDLSPGAASQLGNVSSRGVVGTDENVLIGGVIIGAGQGTAGAGSERALVRGIGPSLTARGVAGALQNPELLLIDNNGAVVASNDDWRQTQETEINATGLAPADDREAAVVATLRKGNYTAIVRGHDRTVGVALVEAFRLP